MGRLVVSGAADPGSREEPRLDRMPRAALIDVLRQADGTPAEILKSDELMDLCLPAIRADLSPWRGRRASGGPVA